MDSKVFNLEQVTSIEVKHLRECAHINYFPGTRRSLFKAAVPEGYYNEWGTRCKQINSTWIESSHGALLVVKDRQVYWPAKVIITFTSGEYVVKIFETDRLAVQYATPIAEQIKKPISFIKDEKTSY